MYYAKELFTKRGPLASVWLAGSVIRRVTKSQILQLDVPALCELVSAPPTPLALPAQSTLLRGMVRIENRKAFYLLEDAEHTTRRLVTHKEARAITTVDPHKLKATEEKITYTIDEQGVLNEDMYPLAGMDECAFLVDGYVDQVGAGDFSLLGEDSEERLKRAEEAAFTARHEDITMGSQDLGALALDELEFGGLDHDMAMEEFGAVGMEEMVPEAELGESLQLGGALSPRSHVSEAGGGITMDFDQVPMPQKKARKRKDRSYLPHMDETSEIDNATLQQQLHDASDILIPRPRTIPPYRMRETLEQAMKFPAAVNYSTQRNAPHEWEQLFRRRCKLIPILNEEGCPPFEADTELTGGGGAESWDFDFEAAGFAEEERAAEMESIGAADVSELSEIRLEHGEDRQATEGGILFSETPGMELSAGGRPIARGGKTRFQVVSELPTPPIELPESQFEIPVEEHRAKEIRSTIQRKEVNKHTEIFRTALETKFNRLSRANKPQEVEFDDLLIDLLKGEPGRRDRGLAFYQLLVLTSLDITAIEQDSQYGEIIIKRGPKFAVRWSNSQMFGSDVTQSQD